MKQTAQTMPKQIIRQRPTYGSKPIQASHRTGRGGKR